MTQRGGFEACLIDNRGGLDAPDTQTKQRQSKRAAGIGSVFSHDATIETFYKRGFQLATFCSHRLAGEYY